LNDIHVFYLLWRPLGIEPVRRFANSYSAFASGHSHNLTILLSGPTARESDLDFLAAFSRIPHTGLTASNHLLDIATYLWAATQTDALWVCFLNSYSELLCPNWLLLLRNCSEPTTVGVTGATGSWESHYTNQRWLLHSPEPDERARDKLHRLRDSVRVQRLRAAYPPFPNYHLRTNAFLIRRDLFLSLTVGSIRLKEDAHRFESGKNGMTAQLLRIGLQPIIVGRNGHGYRKEDWINSSTFRLDDQRNLLIADNRTREYQHADDVRRCTLHRIAWSGAAQ
jgi:hypothetical protein